MNSPTQKIASLLDTGVRTLGMAVNLLMVAAFAYTTSVLAEMFLTNLKAIGSLPSPDIPSIIALAQDPGLVNRLIALAKCWGFGVALLGSSWMTVLGLRWTYHAILSIIHRVKFL